MIADNEEEDAKPAAKPFPPNGAEIPPATLPNTDPTALDPVESQQSSFSGELPFLVTHWLLGYQRTAKRKLVLEGVAAALESEEQIEAVEKIEQAAAELASAFATLGAFGTASRVGCIDYIAN